MSGHQTSRTATGRDGIRRFARLRTVATALLLAALSSIHAVPAHATDIWFSVMEPVWRDVRHLPPDDYMDLFKAGAPWQRAVSDVRVFELSKRAVLETGTADLQTIIDSLKQHNIRLSVQATPLMASRACGLGVEGHGPPDDMVQVATRLRGLGADLAYLRMDEPLWYGHHYDGPRSCHSSIPEIARETADKMRRVRQIYPRVIVGDIEPAGVPPQLSAEWSNDLREWLPAYQIAMGEKLGFFHVDVVWQRPTWAPVLRGIAAATSADRIPLGIIYNGTPADQTDRAWIDDAEAHFRLVEGRMGIRPDEAIIQSWTDYPREMLPENNPASMTNLILRYSTWLTQRGRN